MFEIVPNGPNRLDIELSGKLDAEEMKVALDDLIAKSENIEHGKILYKIGEFDFPTLGAMGVELSRLPKLFGLIGKFDRVAVLANQGWVQTASEIEGFFLPGVEIKAFDRNQDDEAEAWLES